MCKPLVIPREKDELVGARMGLDSRCAWQGRDGQMAGRVADVCWEPERSCTHLTVLQVISTAAESGPPLLRTPRSREFSSPTCVSWPAGLQEWPVHSVLEVSQEPWGSLQGAKAPDKEG